MELTEEREQHIAIGHPDLLPGYMTAIKDTLEEPDSVRRNERSSNTRLFTRWFPSMRGGKHVVVAVASDLGPPVRHWVVTAYITRRLAREVVMEWMKS